MMRAALLLLCAYCAAAAAPTKPVMTSLRRAFVFKAGDCDADGKCYVDFRIPALKRTKAGALIAFAEASGADRNIAKGIHDHGIVARISADGSGRNSSWGKIFKVAYAFPELDEALSNPSPVVDLKTGTIFLHLCRGSEGIDADFAALMTSSTDGGHTWSARTSLNATVKVPGTGWYAPGPGGGIQLPTGRLLTLAEESTPIAVKRTTFGVENAFLEPFLTSKTISLQRQARAKHEGTL